MVSKCPCKNRRCSCNVDGTGGLTFKGNGSARQPYKASWSLWSLAGLDSEQANVTITGDGSFGDPWTISVDTLGGSVVQTIYESDDTWVKPEAGTVAQVVVIGGGGGGGSAGVDAAAGGSGGAGGAMSVAWFPFVDLPDQVDVEVGRGGKGGKAVVGETTGTDGGDSWFGEYLFAGGGKAGKSQAAPSQTQHTTVGGTPPDGGPGGAGAVRDGAGVDEATDHTTYFSPTGGGMGNGTSVGGSGVGTDGGFLAMNSWGGAGGDGGDTFVVGPTSYPGDDGEEYGGGGGGGASDTDDSWPGGNGAQGVVVVTVW